MTRTGTSVSAGLAAVALSLSLAACAQTPEQRDYLDCVTHGWPAEVCSARMGYDMGRGEAE